MLGRRIDEIPVVDVLEMLEIRIEHRVTLGGGATPVVLHHQQQREKSFLVPF